MINIWTVVFGVGDVGVVLQGHLHENGGGDVVVLHPHHDLLLHRQPCR
jgi:hypothetical protein